MVCNKMKATDRHEQYFSVVLFMLYVVQGGSKCYPWAKSYRNKIYLYDYSIAKVVYI